MALYKRGSTWWIDFTTPSGERIRRSSETSSKVGAQELHDRLKAEHWRLQKLGEQPKRTWDEATRKWLQETAHKRTHHEDVLKLDWLQQFLRNRVLADITRDEIAAIGTRKKAESSNATANRYLALIRAILRKASLEWEWIDRVPKVTMYPEPKRRVRWITPKQAKALLEALPMHQRDIALFSLATGLRQSNVVCLCWPQVDLDRRTAWIAADEAKGGEDIHVSLCDLAVEVLERQRDKHSERVFTYDGNPIRYVNTKAWRSALKRAGIADFRWHDLAAHLGQLADPERHSVVRPAGDGRLEIGLDGAAVRALGAGAHGASRSGSRWAAARHKHGTVGRRGDCRRYKKRRHDHS